MNNQPPKFILNFFRWFCHPDLLPSIEGDLLELFEERMREKGVRKARLLFALDVIRLFRPSMIRNFKGPILFHQPGMFRNHFKIALRSALRHKAHFTINLFGLTTGLASFILIMLYIHNESFYDRFHDDADRIYRIVHDQTGTGEVVARIASPSALKNAILNEIPEVEAATHFHPYNYGKALLENENYAYFDERFLLADSSFFDIFSFRFIQGDIRSALDNPSSIVLTKNLAQKFFGDENVIGRELKFNQQAPLIITGVIEDVPSQTHLQFDFLISEEVKEDWSQGIVHTYIKVKPQAVMGDVNRKIQSIVHAHHPPYLTQENIETSYYTQAMTDIHLSAPRLWELSTNGSKLYIHILLAIALFILVIAGINYVNLSTARSMTRSKEIALRKVIGLFRKSLIFQFLVESIFVAAIAAIMAVVFVALALPFFNELMQKDLSLFELNQSMVWVYIGMAILVFGLGSGLYPALYLSSFKPISALQNQFKGSGILNFRKILVVSQFALAAFLIVGVMIVRKQIEYIQSADLGFSKERVIVIDNFRRGAGRDNNLVVRSALEAVPGVIKVGAVNEMIGLQDHSSELMMNVKGSDNQQSVLWTNIGYNYLETMGMELKAGRSFSREFESATSRDVVVLNETAVRMLEVPEPVIGQEIETGSNYSRTIIGVVKDFHFTSLHDEIKPFVFGFTPSVSTLALSLSDGNIQETISGIQETWKSFVPDLPMDFYFLDRTLDQQYRSEKNFNAVFSIMSGLAIVIACLGLFGLAAFIAERRTKEIGIRKALGASVKSIVVLLSGEFAKLVVIANMMAWPFAWFTMSDWLKNFAYRIEIGISIFLLAGLWALIIAMVSVGWQTVNVALTNPVISLKDEK